MIGHDDDKKILMFDIEFSAFFFSGGYIAYKINSLIPYDYNLCLLIIVNILFNVKSK